MRGKAGSARQTNESREADDNAANDRGKVAPNFGGDANLCESECRVKPATAAGAAMRRAIAPRTVGDFTTANAAWLATSVTTLAISPTTRAPMTPAPWLNAASAAVTPAKNGVA
jgi:hypothetical protein